PIVLEVDAALVIKLDQHHWTLDAVVERARLVAGADPGKVRVAEMARDLVQSDLGMPRPDPPDVRLHRRKQQPLLRRRHLGEAEAGIRYLDVVARRRGYHVAVLDHPDARRLLLLRRERLHQRVAALLVRLEDAGAGERAGR